jgi:hypothetical protein
MIDLSIIPVCAQRQDSVSSQLEDLRAVANRLGMHDAADAIEQMFPRLGELEYGCLVDFGTDNIVDDTCVIDEGGSHLCIYAKAGMRREQCDYWRIKPQKKEQS